MDTAPIAIGRTPADIRIATHHCRPHWSPEHSPTVHRLKAGNRALALFVIAVLAICAALWRSGALLQEEIADTRTLVRVIWAHTVATRAEGERPLPGSEAKTAVGDPLVADTLIEIDRGWVRSVIFSLTGPADRPRVACHLRLHNRDGATVAPRLRILLFDRYGLPIGEADPGPRRLLPGETRSYDFEIPIDEGAKPDWFAIRSDQLPDAATRPERSGRGTSASPVASEQTDLAADVDGWSAS